MTAPLVQATVVSNITVIETLTGQYVDPNDNTITVDQLNETFVYNAGTSVPTTQQSAFQQPLTSGAATINLAALPGLAPDETIDGTGQKVQLAKFRNLATNANAITITFGASNPYLLLGTGFLVTLLPGQSFLFIGDEATPDVASGAREIDIAGTGAQILEVQLVLG